MQEFNESVNFAGFICQRDWGVFVGENGSGQRLRADIGIELYTIFGTGPSVFLLPISLYPAVLAGIDLPTIEALSANA